MPRPKKKPHEMTTDEAVRHLFGRKGHAHLQRTAREAEQKAKPKSSRTIKDDST